MQQYCPSCGLVVAMRGPRISYCPRCLTRRRNVVELLEAPRSPVPPRAGRRTAPQPGAPRPQPRAPAPVPRPRRTVGPIAPPGR